MRIMEIFRTPKKVRKLQKQVKELKLEMELVKERLNGPPPQTSGIEVSYTDPQEQFLDEVREKLGYTSIREQ